MLRSIPPPTHPRRRLAGSLAGLFILAAFAGGPRLRAQAVVVPPYVQPGDTPPADGADEKILAWVTEPAAAEYRVDFTISGQAARAAAVETTPLRIGGVDKYRLCTAALHALPANQEVSYRVVRNGVEIGHNTFATRRTADQPIHFIVTGDLASGDPGKFPMAERMVGLQPQFVIVCGDIAYERGRIGDYLAKFWPVYDAAPGSNRGTTIMQSVPFYMAMGNHDAEQDDLTTMPDAFAAYYFFHAPRVAPGTGSWRMFIPGPDDRVRDFEAAAAHGSFPYLSLYSFDDGPAHFLSLDSNAYEPILSADYREWIRRDLANSHARWKFVYFHAPGFHSASQHANQQKMRLLSPLFDETGVDIVFAGHVHNYQRSKPLRFTPKSAIPELGLEIRGKFQLDEQFDGVQHTTPHGVIYIVTGGGGAELYAMPPKKSLKPVVDPDAPGGFTAKFSDERHSVTSIELDAQHLVLREVDDGGAEVDHVTITKP